MDCILSLDVGTTSIKVCISDQNLNQLCCIKKEYNLEASNGFVELEPEKYAEAIYEGVNEAIERSPQSQIKAIVFTTQGETMIPIDCKGTPLRKAIVWLDSRADCEAKHLSARFSDEYFGEITGLPELTGACPIAKLLWIKNNEPDIFNKTAKFLLLEDWLIYKLTGRVCTEKSLVSSSGYFNLCTDDYWQEILECVGVERDKLPELLEPGQFCAEISAEAADRLHIPAKTPVFAGAMDQVASAIGAGAVSEEIVTETTGTALVVAAFSNQRKYLVREGITEYRHAIPGCFLNLSFSNTAGILLKWFKDEFCQDIVQKCKENGGDVFAEMDCLAKTVKPLCDGLSLFPHFEGINIPKQDLKAKGVYFGIGLNTTRGHFIRALLESVAYMLRENVEVLNCNAEEIRSLGGGASSTLWCKIKADVTQKNILTYDAESTSRGAAILGACGLGWYDNIVDACKKTSPKKVYKPGGEIGMYENGYKHYRSMYRQFRQLFQ